MLSQRTSWSSIFLLFSLFLRLVHRGLAGDAVDLNVQLYSDPNCFQPADEMILVDEGCYANRYANITKSFQLKIVVFSGEEKIDLREYVEDCNPAHLYRPARTIEAGRCEPFVGGFYAVFGLRLRSAACEGGTCSPISVARQSFYWESGCSGVASKVLDFPVQGECLRWWNGTRNYRMDDYGENITVTDYPGNDGCNSGYQLHYTIESGTCFPLFESKGPKSFLWRIEAGKNVLTAGAREPHGLLRLMLLWIAVALLSMGTGSG